MIETHRRAARCGEISSCSACEPEERGIDNGSTVIKRSGREIRRPLHIVINPDAEVRSSAARTIIQIELDAVLTSRERNRTHRRSRTRFGIRYYVADQ